MLIIHAPNVHFGGGRSLLRALFAVADRDQCRALVDRRLDVDAGTLQLIAYRTEPSLLGRLIAEWYLSRIATHGDTILCFGNLPPLFSTKARVVLFVQNMFLLAPSQASGFSLRIRIRMRLERLWLKLFHHRACRIIVQTQSVRRAAERALARPVVVQPFVADPTGYVRRAADWLPEPPAEFEFVYVASGDPHKNHANLIAAWMLLADEHHFPSLLLTIDPQREPQLAVMIATARARHRLSIEIWPWQGNGKMAEIYKKAGALIYPSTIESLGLPLIEAAAAGLPIIASERDFVRDVVDPIESFDPESPLSIARAVKRYLGIGELALPLVSARDFLKSALAEGH